MTISVLMSTYYKEKPEYLDSALKSVWTDQIRKPDQIVLIEDGELSDKLYEIVNKWKNSLADSLTVVANKENKGLASALNDGIGMCRGELIARMDSDDISMPKRFLLQEAFMEKNKDVDILGGSIEEFNDEGTLHNIRHYPLSCEDIYQSIHKGSPLAHPTVMFRRRIFDEGLRYSPKYYICEDITLWFDAISLKKQIRNIPDIILQFRRNNSTLYRRGKDKAWSEFKAYCAGIRQVDGILSIKYMYPTMRLIFRLMPTRIVKAMYNSKLRNLILNSK